METQFAGKIWEVRHADNNTETIEADFLTINDSGVAWFYNRDAAKNTLVVYVACPTFYISIRPKTVVEKLSPEQVEKANADRMAQFKEAVSRLGS